MEESVTYQAIIRKGAAGDRRELALRIIRRLGREKLGAPDAAAEAALAAVDDPDRHERIADRMLEAADWADLLATP